MPSRKQRAQIAQETIEILDRGAYEVGGKAIDVSAALQSMISATRLYTPDELDAIIGRLAIAEAKRETKTTVANATTFAAARSLINEGYPDPVCLNFASAKNPGGGFQSGAQAQEECLARASGLYVSLTGKMEYYEVNRGYGSSLYTNHMIYSPGVPVFRGDDDRLLGEPYHVSIITSPAVNARAVRNNEPDNVPAIEREMRTRIRSVLAVAHEHGHTAVVLGAWGCAVFGNEPSQMATWFADVLSELVFAGAFDRVVFAVLDFADGTPTYHAFRDVLA